MCPNINDEQVRNEFNEIVAALGGNPLTIEEFKSKKLRLKRIDIDAAAMDAAYDIWNQNNGHSIDFAPNGKESILMKSLEEYFSDRQKAIIAKANIYSENFKKWFGDWTSEDKTDVSKVVDENGEPLIVYHGTKSQFNAFSKEILGSNTGSDSAKLGFFTSTSPLVSKTYSNPESFNSDNFGVYIDDTPDMEYQFAMDDLSNELNYGLITKDEYELLILDLHDKIKIHQSEKIKNAASPHGLINLFLNIKNPYVFDFESIEQQLDNKLVEIIYDAIKHNNDGVILKNVEDPFVADNFVFFKPDQAKHIRNQGTFKTVDDNFYHSIGISSKGVSSTQRIYVNSGNKASTVLKKMKNISVVYSDLIDKYLSLLDHLDVNIYFSDEIKYKDEKQINGTYSSGTHTITIYYNTDGYKSQPERVILHEVTHGLTSVLLNMNPELLKSLNEYIQYLQNFDNDSLYGFSDEYEFVAEYFSNYEFLNFLKTVPAMDSNKFGNLFKLILDLIIRFFKISNKNAYEQIFPIMEYVVTQQSYMYSKQDVISLNINIENNAVLNAFGDDLLKLNTNIKKGVESRLKSLKRYGKRNLQVEEEISRLIDTLQRVDAREGVLEFVDHVQTTLASSVNWLRTPDLKVSSRQLMQLKHDYLDFYYPMVKSIQYLLNNTNEFEGIENYDRFSDNISLILGNLQYVQNRFDYLLKNNTREFLKDYAEKSGSPFVDEMIQWIEDPKNDISWLSYYVGTSANASNEVIRIMENIIRNTSNKTKRNTFTVGTELVNKLKTAKEEFGNDVMELFREKDKNGLPTGMFTRDLNYGQMRQDETSQINKVIEKLGLSRDEDGNIEFPDYTSKLKFNKEMNKWYSDNTERRYVSEYYELKNSLSEQTQSSLDEIQKELNYIMGRYTIDDIFYSNMLSEEEQLKLMSLLKEKENLASSYYYDGTKKSGTALLIAEELQSFNKKLQGKIKYKPNYAKFNKAISAVAAKYGINSKEYDLWLKFNTEEVYTEEFYDRLNSLDRAVQSKEYQDLLQQRKDLLKLYRLPNSRNEYMDLSEEQQQMLTDLDKKIDAAKTKNPKNNFGEFATIGYTQQYYDDYNQAKSMGEEEFQKWFNRNHYESGSRMVPNSRYTYVKPKPELMAKYAKIEPGRFFKELDLESEFANLNFDINGDYVQPKRSKYDNSKAYSKITGSAKVLYDSLIDIMSESNNKIAFLGNANPFKLPQMSARDLTLLNSGGLTMDNIAYVLKDNLFIKDDDTDYNLSNSTRPDGSVIKHVPTRFIKMLDDPSKITTDVVGSVIMFYHMAENFKNMTEVQDDLEMILERMSQLEIKEGKNQKLAGTLNAFKKAQDLIDMNLYGMRKQRTTVLGKDISKPLGNLYSAITKINLAWNPWAMATNAITGQGYTDMESILGRYYDTSDIRFAKSELMANLADITSNIGNVNHKNKIMMMLQYNQVSRSNEETFERLDQSALLRALNQHFWFNGFSAGDFIVKSQATLSIYHNYKLIDGKFIPKNEFKGTKEEWDKATILYDAYEVKDGNLQVKQQYKKYVSEALENRIQNKISAITAKIDGMLNDTDKAAIHANTYAQFLVMHRNFMIVGMEDRFKNKQFNYNTGEVESGLYTTVFQFIKNLVSSKNINVLKQAAAQYEQLNDFEKYNLKKVILEFANLIALSTLVSVLLVPAADDDKDNWKLQAISYVAMRTAFEFRTLYNPFELTALLNSPSAAINIIETGAGMLKVIWPGTYLGDNPFAPVKSGAYKGLPKVLRNIIKVTPGHHVFEALDESTIRAKRNYLENQLMF